MERVPLSLVVDDPQLSRALNQNGDFVRALAHRLVGDPHRADDLVQETWLRFLERKPRATGSLRHWFRTVARNLASSAGRGERNRRERDERAARPEGLPSAVDEFAHAELLRAMVEAVLALEEPYRSTLLARYYRGWSAARLASETNTPLATVRSREQRALEQLRAKLDKHAGQREAWALALGRVLALEPQPSFAPSVSPGLATAVVAAAAVVAGFAWYAPRGAPAPELLLAPRLAPEPVPEPAPLTTPVPSREPVASAVAAADAHGGPADASAQSVVAVPLSEIRARFVFSDGTPAAGVAAMLELGRTINRGGIESRGSEPLVWEDRSLASGTDGRVALSFAKPRDHSLELGAKLHGHASISWHWVDVAPGAVLDLGDVVMQSAAAVTGRLVRPDGTAIVGQEWSVDCTSVGLATADGRNETRVHGSIDAATGTFRLEGLQPGMNALGLRHALAGQVVGPRVMLEKGVATSVDLVYAGPDLARQIVVAVEMQRFRTVARVGAENIWLLADGAPARHPLESQELSSRFVFENLEPGSYALEIDDPRCVLWRREEVRPGTRVPAMLEGNSAVILDVRDAETGTPIAPYEAKVTLRNVNTFPNTFGAGSLVAGRIGGMFAGDSTIEVRAGERVGSAEVDGLAIGETRAVAITLAPLASVAGIARFTDGAPAVGLTAALLRPAVTEESNASPILRLGSTTTDDTSFRVEVAVAEVDARGRFTLVAPQAGDYLVRVSSDDGTEVFSATFRLASVSRTDLELVLARPGSLAGRVRIPAGASVAGLWVHAFPAFPPQRADDVSASASSALDADGRFTIPSLASGPTRLFLMLPRQLRHRSGGWTMSSSGWNGSRPVLARQLGSLDVPEGGALEQEFTLDDFPGTLELSVRVNGAPAPRLGLRLKYGEQGDFEELEAETDDHGVFGPAPLFAGAWTVEAEDLDTGWRATYPDPLVITPAAPAISALEFERP